MKSVTGLKKYWRAGSTFKRKTSLLLFNNTYKTGYYKVDFTGRGLSVEIRPLWQYPFLKVTSLIHNIGSFLVNKI